ncbi:hypothetical protein LJC04_06720, partial [Ruminococcaceae bacterium OttesenSCG-928-O06]|nr:hypothetical protein [Ruminococcaceae bacterium OttesenSCG-928-O06]
VFMAAIRPLIKNKWIGAAGYAFLLFNPIAFSTQITRLYRDIGYYSVSFLCVAATLGFLLRYGSKNAGVYFALPAGLFLAFAHNFREDSHWLYVYVVACLLAWFIFRLLYLKNRTGEKKAKTTAVVPLLIVTGWLFIMLPVSLLNLGYYGTFTIDEYNSGAYAKAFGALKRIDGGLEDPHIVIPEEQRMALYELSPAFSELYSQLDAPNARYRGWKEEQGEYRTGYFSFVLRDAVAVLGYYENADTANAYYERLANEVNAVCDQGLIEAGPRSYGITAKYYPWMTGPIIEATFQGMWQTLQCTGINPLMLPVNEDDAYLKIYENFVYDTISADRYMEDGSTVSNYSLSGIALWGQRFLRVVVLTYRYLLPYLFFAALVCFVAVFVGVIFRKKSGLSFFADSITGISLLCLFLLRSAMIGFVHVSSFSAISNPAYQAANYPIILAFVVVAIAYGIKWVPQITRFGTLPRSR